MPTGQERQDQGVQEETQVSAPKRPNISASGRNFRQKPNPPSSDSAPQGKGNKGQNKEPEIEEDDGTDGTNGAGTAHSSSEHITDKT